MTTIFECSGLAKKYGSQKAVDNLNLKIECSRVYAMIREADHRMYLCKKENHIRLLKEGL